VSFITETFSESFQLMQDKANIFLTNLQEQIEQLCWPEGRRAGAHSKAEFTRE